jgi:2-dehydropantoate 2-reductase
MRFLVVGAGATGGYFGARLAHAGRDVSFLVRPARAEQLRCNGLELLTPSGNLHLEPRLVTTANLKADYDAVILAVKAYGLDAALADMAPAIGERAVIVPFLNGMRHIDALTARFGQGPVLGGVCLVSTQLDAKGRIVALSDMQELVYGERDGKSSERVAALDVALQNAGFAARSSSDIIAEMWSKWVSLAALGAITCLMRGNVGEIAAAPNGADLARQMLDECAAIATAAGHAPPPAVLERMGRMLTDAGSTLAASMYRDLQQGRRIEADQVVGDLLAHARQFGVAAPLLTAAFAHLRVYDDRVGQPDRIAATAR